jgi:biopolymer transport protein ExbD
MLVLLVIFMVTAPILTHSVRIDLPRASSNPVAARTTHVDLAIDSKGAAYWDGEPVNPEELSNRFRQVASLSPQPEVHVRADRVTQYQNVAGVVAGAARAGISRIGFISEPDTSK